MQHFIILARNPSNICTPPEGDVGGSTRRLIRPLNEETLHKIKDNLVLRAAGKTRCCGVAQALPLAVLSTLQRDTASGRSRHSAQAP